MAIVAIEISDVAGMADAVRDAWAIYGTEVTATTAILAVLLAVLRAEAVRRARRQRRTVMLKPTNTFDPSSEEVLRFCGQLTRTRPATATVVQPASTRTVRIRLVAAGEGRMAHLIEGPARAETVLRKQGFAEVELAAPESVLSSSVATPREAASQDREDDPEPTEGQDGEADESTDAPAWSDEEHTSPGGDDSEFDLGGTVDDPVWVHPEEREMEPVRARPMWSCLEEGDER